MANLSSDVSHEAFCIAEEIVDGIGILGGEPRRAEVLAKIQKRLEAFAAALLSQAAKKGDLAD